MTLLTIAGDGAGSKGGGGVVTVERYIDGSDNAGRAFVTLWPGGDRPRRRWSKVPWREYRANGFWPALARVTAAALLDATKPEGRR